MSYTFEETKAWLQRAWHVDLEITTLMRKHYRAYMRATAVTSQLNGMPGSPSKDPHKFDDIAGLENQIAEQVRVLTRVKEETHEVIMSVNDDTLRELLLLYYDTDRDGNHLQLRDVAAKMSYSESSIKRLHSQAIAEVMKTLNLIKDDTQ